MLQSLSIQNFALVDRLELDLGAGLHVITGETGAGKSIILDALDAVLGGRVPGKMVRTGESRAQLEATFKMLPSLGDWLEEHEIELLEDSVVVCSREIVANGNSSRSRSRVNGVLVNRQQMESLRERLVEITAQGQTVQLGQAAKQREWLDSFGGADILAQRQKVAAIYGRYQSAFKLLEHRRNSEGQRLQQLDMYQFQAKELEDAHLEDPNELNTLQQEHQRLGHAVELQQQSFQVYNLLYENDSGNACADLLGQAEATLQDMLPYDDDLKNLVDLVNEAITQVQEAGLQMNSYGSGLETDPARLADIDARISELKQICRKYGPSLEDAIAYYKKIRGELDAFGDEGQTLEALQEAVDKAEAELTKACKKLTSLRKTAAKTLEAKLLDELKPLAMEKVKFQVQLAPTTPTATGGDHICFLLSPNPGEPLQPLSETASGGEMSRFLLALKSCFSAIDPVGTLVFDEIDTGVSGRVSQAIADKLRQLGKRHQVLCVTHQPLIAAVAEHHFRVKKEVLDSDRTVVRITSLAEREARRQELAELAGGKSAQEAIAFADSLLEQAGNGTGSHGTGSNGTGSNGTGNNGNATNGTSRKTAKRRTSTKAKKTAAEKVTASEKPTDKAAPQKTTTNKATTKKATTKKATAKKATTQTTGQASMDHPTLDFPL